MSFGFAESNIPAKINSQNTQKTIALCSTVLYKKVANGNSDTTITNSNLLDDFEWEDIEKLSGIVGAKIFSPKTFAEITKMAEYNKELDAKAQTGTKLNFEFA